MFVLVVTWSLDIFAHRRPSAAASSSTEVRFFWNIFCFQDSH